MVQSCCAYNCAERYKRGTDISFHKFPEDLSLKNQWLCAIRRENFKPSKWTRICSNHFTPDSFTTTGWSSTRKLRSDAIPSIFNFPSHLIKKSTTRKLPAIRNVEEVKSEDTFEISTNTPVEPPAKKRRLTYAGDFNELESSTSKIQHYKRRVKKILINKNKRIKILQQRNRRLTKRVTNLESLLKYFKQQNMIDEESSLKLSVC